MKFRLMRSPDGDGGNGNNPPPPPPPPAAPDMSKVEGDAFLNLFPQEVRSAGYMKDVKNWDGLVKKFDGAQKLLGERQFPDANSTPEQWNAFFAKTGRPEKPEGYKFGPVEGLPDDMIKTIQSSKFTSIMHAAGLSQAQAEKFFMPILKEMHAAELAEKAAEDKTYNDFMDTTFGQDRKVIEDNAKKYLAANLPAEMVPMLEKMDPTSMGIMTAAIDKIVTKLGGQDAFRGKGPASSSGTGPLTAESIKTQMMEVMRQPEYDDPFKDKAKHAELMAKMNDLRTKLKTLS